MNDRDNNKIDKSTALTAVIYILIWIIILLFDGVVSVGLWAAVKLIFPVVGVCLFVWSLVSLLRNKKKKILQNISRLVLSVLIMMPMLMTIGLLRIPYPTSIESIRPSLTVKWPLKRSGTVAWGGNSYDDNVPHAMWGSERWAYDLVMRPYDIGSDKLTDYGIWNQEVISPVSAKVISSYDKETDIQPNTENFKSLSGNHVYLYIPRTKTYLLLTHFMKDSIRVKKGDKVKAGEIIGRVGNSGTTSEPHLHIHHQRQDPTKVMHPLLAESLPLYFEIDGQSQMPTKNTLVRPN